MNKQQASGRKDGYARISGLADICERPHMSTEQRKGASRACSGAGCECVEHCGSAEHEAMRSLIIHVCGHPPMATSMKKEAAEEILCRLLRFYLVVCLRPEVVMLILGAFFLERSREPSFLRGHICPPIQVLPVSMAAFFVEK